MYTISVVAEDVGGFNNVSQAAENVFKALAHACESTPSSTAVVGTGDGGASGTGTSVSGADAGVRALSHFPVKSDRAQSNLPVKLSAAASVPFITNLKHAASSVHLYGLSAVTGTSVR